MVLEDIYYYLILLRSGFYDELFKAMDEAFEKEREPEGIFIDLAFCGSDKNRIISVLNEYRSQIKREPNFDAVAKKVMDFLIKLYKDGEYSLREFAEILFIMGDNGASYDDMFSEPWQSMMMFEEFYGVVDEDSIRQSVEHFLLTATDDYIEKFDFLGWEEPVKIVAKKPKFFAIFKRRKEKSK